MQSDRLPELHTQPSVNPAAPCGTYCLAEKFWHLELQATRCDVGFVSGIGAPA